MTHPQTGEPARPRVGLALAAAVLVTLAVRALPAVLLEAEVSDVPLYREMGEAVLRGDSVYAPAVFFPYLPYSQVIPAACLRISRAAGLPFPLAMKLPNVLGDAFAAAALLLALARRMPPGRALGWTMAFALNPVSILISAFHGNLMGLVADLVAIAFALGLRARDRASASPDGRAWAAAAALVLGCAVAMRSFPVLLVPAFATWLGTSRRRAAALAALAGVASFASALPYLVLLPGDLLREVTGYSGVADVGWLAAFRALPLVLMDRKVYFFGSSLLGPSKALFLASVLGTAAFLPAASAELRLRLALVPMLLFYGLYGGLSAQYLVWIVPLAALLSERRLLVWSAVATATLLAFYRVYHPGILLGGPAASPDGTVSHVVLAVGNAALVALSLRWCADVLSPCLERSADRRPLVRIAAAGGAVAFGLLLLSGFLEALRYLD